jgi:hypothetical protein
MPISECKKLGWLTTEFIVTMYELLLAMSGWNLDFRSANRR